MILLLELLTKSLIVLLHLLFLKFFPLGIDLFVKSLLPALELDLLALFGDDVAHEHLGVKSLHLILTVVEDLVGLVNLLLSK